VADTFEDEMFVRTKAVEPKKALMDLDSFMNQTQKSVNSKEDEEDDYTETTGTETSDCSVTSLGGSFHSHAYSHRRLLRVASDASEEENQSIDFKTLRTHRLLGEGYFGQVYLVSTDEEHVFALKKLSKYHVLVEGQVASVKNEKQILSKLHHPNIVQLKGTWQDEHSLYFLQSYYPGGELFTHMHHNKLGEKLPEPHCRFYSACIVDALWYMHCQNIVYRDLKPENVLIDERGYPILVDFGYAKELTGDEAMSYTLCGTPKYVPPEMIKGNAHTYTADYWSMGVILYELLSNEHPFEFYENMDDLSLYASIAEAEYLELPEDVSDSARDIVDKLLVKKPAKRLGAQESKTSNEILEHRWLKCIDLGSLRRKLIPAPWIPTLSGPMDTRHFEVIEGLGESSGNNDAKLTLREQVKFFDF
jgi:protein kinase A